MRAYGTLGVAVASVLLLVAVLSPGDASADEPQASDTSIIQLERGVNFLGWVGEAMPIGNLFEAVPEIEVVYSWDPQRQRWSMASPVVPSRLWGLRELNQGRAYVLRLSNGAALETPTPECHSSKIPTIEPGHNLIAWTGCAIDVADAFEMLGPLTSEISLLGGGLGQPARYSRADSAGPSAAAPIQTGAPIWVHRSRLESCPRPSQTNFTYEAPEGADPEVVRRATRAVEDVIAYFHDRYGIRAEALHVEFEDKPWGGWASGGLMNIALGRFDSGSVGFSLTEGARLVAHEYWHVLQFALSEGRNWPPVWLVEGTATYMERQYLEHRSLPVEEPVLDALAPSLEVLAWYGFTGWDYHVGAVASRSLYSREPVGAFIEFWCRLNEADSWQEAFESAFELPAREFYAAYEESITDLPVSNRSEEYVLTLPRGKVTGTVEWSDGTPLAGARVMADRLARGPWSITWTSTLSDADGQFELDVVIGCCGETGEDGVFSGYEHVFSIDPFRDGCQRFYGESGSLVDRQSAQVIHVDRDVAQFRFVLPEGTCARQDR